jgi:hypothetical protein
VQESDKNPAVAAAAERHGATQHQIVLAWLLAISPQILPIPGTGSPRHAEENIAAAAIELDPDEVDAISKGALPDTRRTRLTWLARLSRPGRLGRCAGRADGGGRGLRGAVRDAGHPGAGRGPGRPDH